MKIKEIIIMIKRRTKIVLLNIHQYSRLQAFLNMKTLRTIFKTYWLMTHTIDSVLIAITMWVVRPVSHMVSSFARLVLTYTKFYLWGDHIPNWRIFSMNSGTTINLKVCLQSLVEIRGSFQFYKSIISIHLPFKINTSTKL